MANLAPEIERNYGPVSRALLFLAENYRRHPSLNDVAAIAGMSPWYFQREFTRLAGVSPKSFISHLTLEYAKGALRQGRPVLDAALGAGLSGPSRLHDLALKIEAMTPGEYARRGAGMVIRYGWEDSLPGRALLAATKHGLCGLSFGAEGEEADQLAEMAARWPAARFIKDTDVARTYGRRIFCPLASEGKPVPIRLIGTPWQIQVWKALLAIPAGAVIAYGTLAERLSMPGAARATAAAIARNPLALLIPCHRVIAASGALGGYRWGEARKRALLALEAARRDAAR